LQAAGDEGARNRRGSEHRCGQVARVEPDFLAGDDVRGHCAKEQSQVFDLPGAEQGTEQVFEPAAGEQAGARDHRVEQFQHVAAPQLAHGGFEGVDAAGRVATADPRPDAGAADRCDAHAGGEQLVQHAHVRQAARGAAAEREHDSERLPSAGGGRGHRKC